MVKPFPIFSPPSGRESDALTTIAPPFSLAMREATDADVEEIANRLAMSEALHEALLRAVGQTVDDLVYMSELGEIDGEEIQLSAEQEGRLKNAAIEGALDALNTFEMED